MIIKLERLEVQSRRDMEMIDVTADVDRVVAASGVTDGLVLVMTCHTSSGLIVTEGVECLERDVLAHLERLAPRQPPEGSGGYNAGDHLKSILGGVNCFFPIENGGVVRGSRQRVYFVEYDGPLARTVLIQVIGQ